MTWRLGRTWTLAVLGVSCLAAPAPAQIGSYSPPQVRRPTIPPAINMRSGNPLTSYFGVVRPQQETNRALQQLQQDFPLPSAAPIDPGFGPPDLGSQFVSTTGHGVSFFNTRQYFSGPNNRYSLGSSGAPVAGGAAGIGGGGFLNPRPALGVPVSPGLTTRR